VELGAREKMGDSLDGLVNKKKEEPKKEEKKLKGVPPFEGYIAVKEKLKSIATSQITQELLNRPDGLHHLLLSDSQNLLKSLVYDFPDICSLLTIGTSVEGRPLNVLQI
jgi:hypothetical protein